VRRHQLHRAAQRSVGRPGPARRQLHRLQPEPRLLDGVELLHDVLEQVQQRDPGWTGVEIAKGWGTYIKNGSSTQFTVKWSKAKRSTTSACATSALKVSLGPANGAAGTVFYPLNFANTSKLACTLRGYPGVSAVTSSGKQIGSPASQISTSYKTVTVLPGKTQSAPVGIVETGNFDPSQCAPVTAAGLKVFPPGQSKAVTIKKSFSTCSSTSVISLTVRPVS
jgi:hypothetical protein